MSQLQKAAESLSEPEKTQQDIEEKQKNALRSLQKRQAPMPVLRPDGSIQRQLPVQSQAEQDTERLAKEHMLQKPIGPIGNFNEESSKGWEAAQLAALGKLNERMLNTNVQAPTVQNKTPENDQGNLPDD